MKITKVQKIQKEVEKTLLLLDENEDAKLNLFFYTRLAARLNETLRVSDSNLVPDFFDRIKFGVIIPVVCAVLLLFNIITLAYKYNTTETDEIRKNELIQDLRSEYDSITGNSMRENYGN